MVRHFRRALVGWPLAMSVACADDRIGRSEGAAPDGVGSSGSRALPDDGAADLGLAGSEEPGPVAPEDGVTLGDGMPGGDDEAPGDGALGNPTASGGDVAPDAEVTVSDAGAADSDAGAAVPDAGAEND